MLVEELAFGVAINANVWIQPNWLSAPQLRTLFLCTADLAVLRSTGKKVLERGRTPEPFGEDWVINLVAVVDSNRLALLGPPRRCSQRKRGQKGNVVFA